MAALFLAGTLALAVASADRVRRSAWGAAAVLVATQLALPFVVGPVAAIDLDPLASIRGLLRASLERLLPEPDAALSVGIVLGERAGIPTGLREAFRVTGTAHLLAISGHNMTLLAGAVAIIGRGVLGPRATAALAVACISGYALLVGLGPSVARAAVMAAIAGLGLALGRRSLGANALCAAAAIMLAIAPDAIGDVGFQLSVAATAGLLLFEAPIAARLSALPGIARDGLAATLAATIPTLPLIAATFGRVSLVSPFANVFAVPVFAPLLVAGALASALGAASADAARPLALATLACTRALRAIVETAALVPLAAIEVPDGALGAVLATGVLIGVWRAGPHVARSAFGLTDRGPFPWVVGGVLGSSGFPGRTLRFITAVGRGPLPRSPITPRHSLDMRPRSPHLVIAAAAAASLLLVVPILWFALLSARPEIRVRALDVGQGDAFLIESREARILVDGGPDAARLLARLAEALPPWERRIDVVALTHAHVDHGVGLLAVLERYEVGLAIEPRGLDASQLATSWRERAARAGVPVRTLAAGARVRIGDVVLAALAPNDDPRVDLPNLVLRVERGAFSVLLLGDATEQSLADLLLAPEQLRARVYVPPHHGAETAHAAALVAAVRPDVAVLSVGASNRYGHPTRTALGALAGVATYRTDRDGTVEIATDGSRLIVRTSARAAPPHRGGSIPSAPASR